tara:strand:+ start:4074 stop:4259 length:186 start_codon:yes stop_codon:yes gene_type:complete
MCHPTNTVTGEEMGAWVVDFGGMNSAELVVEGQRETMEGDRQGVGRVFGVWLPGKFRYDRR